MFKKLSVTAFLFLSLQAMDRPSAYTPGEQPALKRGCWRALKRSLHLKHNVLCGSTFNQLCKPLVKALKEGDIEMVLLHATTKNINYWGIDEKEYKNALQIILDSSTAHKNLIPLLGILKNKGFDFRDIRLSDIYSTPLECITQIAEYCPYAIHKGASEGTLLWKLTQLSAYAGMDIYTIAESLPILYEKNIITSERKLFLAQKIIELGSVERAIVDNDENFFFDLLTEFGSFIISHNFGEGMNFEEYLRYLATTKTKTQAFYETCTQHPKFLELANATKPLEICHPIDYAIVQMNSDSFKRDLEVNASSYINDIYGNGGTLPQYLQYLYKQRYITRDWYHQLNALLHDYCFSHPGTRASEALAYYLDEAKTNDLDTCKQYERVANWNRKVSEDTMLEGREPIIHQENPFKSLKADDDDSIGWRFETGRSAPERLPYGMMPRGSVVTTIEDLPLLEKTALALPGSAMEIEDVPRFK